MCIKHRFPHWKNIILSIFISVLNLLWSFLFKKWWTNAFIYQIPEKLNLKEVYILFPNAENLSSVLLLIHIILFVMASSETLLSVTFYNLKWEKIKFFCVCVFAEELKKMSQYKCDFFYPNLLFNRRIRNMNS